MSKITCCDNCPFNVPGGEYDGYCGHPSAIKKVEEGQQYKDYPSTQTYMSKYFGYDEKKYPINPDTGKTYHFETVMIPQWCPLRNVESISIPELVKIELDSSLFEEKYK